MAKLNQNMKFILVAGAVIGLSACSAKPSPWSQQGSPWEARQQEVVEQPVVEEEPVVAETETMPMHMEEPAAVAVVEEEVDLGEPGTPMEDPSEAVEESPIAEPVLEEAVIEIDVNETEPAQAGDIASLPADQFAVQVVASSSMENLLAFARANNIADDLTAKTMIGDKVWYILLSGVYASKAEANQALAEVSGQLETTPWIRNIGSIQAVMTP